MERPTILVCLYQVFRIIREGILILQIMGQSLPLLAKENGCLGTRFVRKIL